MITCDAPDNHTYLLERFCTRLFDERPESVLDVGCGAGKLLSACALRGISASGIESSEERLEQLAQDGHEVQRASATQLPFDEAQFDWVVMRHVPHHLEDPGSAFHEAARVARRGLLIAEPWFDARLESQRIARAFDSWLKLEHRRGGMFHGECLDAEALYALLPDRARADVELETVLRLRARSVQSLEQEAEPYAREHDEQAEPVQALRELTRQARQQGLSWNGSLFLIAHLSRA